MSTGAQRPKLDLRTEVIRTFTLPLDFGGKTYRINGTYRVDTEKHTKELKIDVPDLPVPAVGRGLYARFEQYTDTGHLFGNIFDSIKCYPNQDLKKLFKESVQPVLEERLPKHMTKLIHFGN